VVEIDLEELQRDGFALLPAALTAEAVAELTGEIEQSLASETNEAVALRNRAGIYGARNILDICPAARDAWRVPALLELLTLVLGKDFGLVRGLYFDKPPEKSWSLPWHQDLTIAVKDNRLPSEKFRRPTIKAGVPHVEAPPEVLMRMLTLRIHLDDVTLENGPLRVLPGTHMGVGNADRPAEAGTPTETTILAQAGDVLAMRPLLFHSSSVSSPGNTQHRRILHLEFAADEDLPDGYAWRQFERQ
jgi:ectoine hydroxylase-related dioxygenase (phytanoyl-CoA dioxygenase family)